MCCGGVGLQVPGDCGNPEKTWPRFQIRPGLAGDWSEPTWPEQQKLVMSTPARIDAVPHTCQVAFLLLRGHHGAPPWLGLGNDGPQNTRGETNLVLTMFPKLCVIKSLRAHPVRLAICPLELTTSTRMGPRPAAKDGLPGPRSLLGCNHHVINN